MNTADILEKAADLIEPPGKWGQGCLGGKRGEHCADTAIFKIARQLRSERRAEVRIFFAKFVGGHNSFDTYRWNDAPERTQAEVVAKLREAAALAREQQQ